MKILCKHNDPDTVLSGIPNNFDFGLELNKAYLVMGLLNYKQSNTIYYLIDEGGRPSWFPHQIFEIISNKIPQHWYLKINAGNDYVDYQNLIGFEELCNKPNFFNELLEREKEAMQIYFRRKIELEGMEEDYY